MILVVAGFVAGAVFVIGLGWQMAGAFLRAGKLMTRL